MILQSVTSWFAGVRRTQLWLYIGAAILVLVILTVLIKGIPKSGPAPTNFDECSKLYKVTGTNPRVCSVPWGKTYTQFVGNGSDPAVTNVHLELAAIPNLAQSPFTFGGVADKDWFDAQGHIDIKLMAGTGSIIAHTQGATDDKTPGGATFNHFTATLTFTHPDTGSMGAMVITKSGTQTALVIPVSF